MKSVGWFTLLLFTIASAVASPLKVQVDQTQATFTWFGSQGQSYSLQKSNDLNQWQPVLEASGIVGMDRESAHTIPLPLVGRQFYRLLSYPVSTAPIFGSEMSHLEIDQSEIGSGFFLPPVSDPQGGDPSIRAFVAGEDVSVNLTSKVFTLSAPDGFTGTIPVTLVAISETGAATRQVFDVVVRNFPLFDVCAVPILGNNPPRAVAEPGEEGFGLVGQTNAIWNRNTLRVFFTTPDFQWFGSAGSPPADAVGDVKVTVPPAGTGRSIRDVIMDCANEWTRFANIDFHRIFKGTGEIMRKQLSRSWAAFPVG